MIGRVDRLDMRRRRRPLEGEGRRPVAACSIRRRPKPGVAIYNCERQDHGLDKALDNELIADGRSRRSSSGEPVRIELPIRNVNRTVGAMLSGEVARRYGHAGLPEDTISVQLHAATPGRASAPSSRAASRSS